MNREFKYGQRVIVSAWGGTVRLSDVRRTGTVAKVNAKTVAVFWDHPQSGPVVSNVPKDMLNPL